MSTPSFSQRYGLSQKPDQQGDDFLPSGARQDSFYQLGVLLKRQCRSAESGTASRARTVLLDVYTCLRPLMRDYTGKRPPDYEYNNISQMWDNVVPNTLELIPWNKFYDLCQDIHAILLSRFGEGRAEEYRNVCNYVFQREFVTWGFTEDGRIERIQPPEVAEQLQQAKGFLSLPGFEGPLEQYSKANQFLNQRPSPDGPNCAKEAVSALEGVARIISGQPKATLSTLLNGHFRYILPATLRESTSKLYAYRGDTEGVSHGQTQQGSVTVEEAEWVLGMCAVTISYLLKVSALTEEE